MLVYGVVAACGLAVLGGIGKLAYGMVEHQRQLALRPRKPWDLG